MHDRSENSLLYQGSAESTMPKSFIKSLGSCIFNECDSIQHEKLRELLVGAIKQLPSGQLKTELERHIDKHLKKLERRLKRLSKRNSPRNIKDLDKLPSSGHAELKEVGEEKQLVYNLMHQCLQEPDDAILEAYSSRDKTFVYKLFLKNALHIEDVSDKKIKSALQHLVLVTNEQQTEGKEEFDWLLQMETLLQLSATSRPYGIIRVLKLLFEMTENDVKLCIEKNECIRAGHLAAILKRCLVSCHVQVIGKTLKLSEEKAYTCYMTALLSGYVDLHCINSSKILKKKLLGLQLCGFVSHILSLWPERLLELVVQLTCITADTVKVVLPLVRNCLGVKPAGRGHSFYLKYVLLVRLLRNTIGSLNRVQKWIITTKDMAAEKGFCEWLQGTCPECIDHIPFEDRKFKKRKVTRFLLLEANDELVDLLMNSLYNQESSDVAVCHKDVSLKTESNNVYFLDTAPSSQGPIFLNTIEDLECLLDKTDNEQHMYRINPDLISERFTDPMDQKFMTSDIVSITRVTSDDETNVEDIENDSGEIAVGDESSEKQIQTKRVVEKLCPIVKMDCQETFKDSLSSCELHLKLTNSSVKTTDTVISITDSDEDIAQEDIAVDTILETCDNNTDIHQQDHKLNELKKLDNSQHFYDSDIVSRNQSIVSEADNQNECITSTEVDGHCFKNGEDSMVCNSVATIATVQYTGSPRDSRAKSMPKSSLKSNNEEKLSKDDKDSRVRSGSNAVFANVYYTRSQRRSRARLTPKSNLDETINKDANGNMENDNYADLKSPRHPVSKSMPKSIFQDTNEATIAKDDEGNTALDNDANVHSTKSPRLSGTKLTSKTAEDSIRTESDASNSYVVEVRSQSTSRTLSKNVEDKVKSGFNTPVKDSKLVKSRRSLPAKATFSKGNIPSDKNSANSDVNPMKSVNRLISRRISVEVGGMSESDCGNASPCRRSLRLKNVSKLIKEKTDSSAEEAYTSIKSKPPLSESAVKDSSTKLEQRKTINAEVRSGKALRRNFDEYDFNSDTESVDKLDVKNVSYKGLSYLSTKRDSAIKSQPSFSSATSGNMSSPLTKQVQKSEPLLSARKRRLTVTGKLALSGNEFDEDVSHSKVAKITAEEKKTPKRISSSPAAVNRQPTADVATCSMATKTIMQTISTDGGNSSFAKSPKSCLSRDKMPESGRSPQNHFIDEERSMFIASPRVRWTEDEMLELYQAVKKFGTGNWREIKQYLNSPRSNINLKDKWRHMVQHNKLDEIKVLLSTRLAAQNK